MRPKLDDMQTVYSKTLIEIGEKDPRVIVLDADLSHSNKTSIFAKRFPNRFFESGIAEANMIGVAAGLATVGLIPFVNTFAVFATGRVYDQVRVSICYQNLNVKITGTSSGLSDCHDGATHQSIEDIALMRSLPNMTIISPCDNTEAYQATRAIHGHVGPVYLRLNRMPVLPVWESNGEIELVIGEAIIAEEGEDAYIISSGYPLGICLKASKLASEKNLSVGVLDLHTIKPIDKKSIIEAAKSTGAIVTVEEHNIIGALGSAVSEVLSENNPVPLERIGICDRFGESSLDYQELLQAHGITVENTVAAVERVVKRK